MSIRPTMTYGGQGSPIDIKEIKGYDQAQRDMGYEENPIEEQQYEENPVEEKQQQEKFQQKNNNMNNIL